MDRQLVCMELDTRAALTLMSEASFRSKWPNKSLQQSNVTLHTYTGEQLKAVGSTILQVCHGRKEAAELPLLIVPGNGQSLLGRNWLGALKLDWGLIHQLWVNPLEQILSKHSTVFKDELGKLEGYNVKIHVDPTVRPKFCRARAVSYAMKSLVDQELDRLRKLGIIEPLQFSDWAASIVPVLKADKHSVRLCVDFKMTVNTAAKVDHYPIPRIEDLFVKLNGGKKFSKLDSSQTYNQLVLDNNLKKLVVINTHQGLFQFNHLPFGIF